MRRNFSRRQRKICLSIGSVALGTTLLSAAIVWIEARRDTDLGDPMAGITATALEAAGAPAPPIRFRDVAQELGVVMRHGPGKRGQTLPEDTGGGVAWGDYDNDGDWDLYFTNFPGPPGAGPVPGSANCLFRNDGGRFIEVARQAGADDPQGFGMGATFADYDNDGDLDLYVTNFGPNRLFRNRGDGTFEEVAEKAGVADPSWSTGAAWGDFDRDGHLDLYVCNYVKYDKTDRRGEVKFDTAAGSFGVPFTLNPNSFGPMPNRLYRNRGDETFEEVAEACGVSNPDGRSLAATFCDLDGDGWLDLYVNNDVSTNRLYRNLGGESRGVLREGRPLPAFADLSAITGTADPRGSMGLSVGEIGSISGTVDSLPDLFITHWVAEENALYQSVMGPGGTLEYRDKTRQLRLGEISIDTVGWGCAFADLDLDGRPDLVVVNGSTLQCKDDPSRLMAEPIFLFWNDGKCFQNVAPAAGETVAKIHCARGLAVADFDGDGDLDLAVAVNRGQPLLLRNETSLGHCGLKVLLAGPAAACFGACVEVEAGPHRQVQWHGADASFLGMHAPELVFGLGKTSRATRVRVRWADGRESVLADVPAGRVTIEHPGRGTLAAGLHIEK